MKPILPAIGSIITAARSSFNFSNVSKKSFLLLNSQLIVCFANCLGIPGESVIQM